MYMKIRLFLSVTLSLMAFTAIAGGPVSGPKLPAEVRGFCIGLPSYDRVDEFVRFMEQELVPRKVNLLVLRIDYGYRYTSHPELVNPARRRDDTTASVALTRAEMKKIVDACRRNGIMLVPLVNLFGHQSWSNKIGSLLREYPQFDETPGVRLPENYKWPNPDGLYCKSYCPLHPDVHKVVFDLVDEIMDVCETSHFHAGMDEVFYIGMDECPRCKGRDRSVLFADEVNRIRDHVAARKGRLWIWGDRMIDGKATKLGMWEGSENDTHRSIDLIRKDVVINDWHYDSNPKTAETFAQKGYDVLMCPWNKPDVAKAQVADHIAFRNTARRKTARRYRGFMQTVWVGADAFMDAFKGLTKEGKGSSVDCFKTLVAELDAAKGKSSGSR